MTDGTALTPDQADEWAIPAPGMLPAPSAEQIQVWWALVEVGRFEPDLRQSLAQDLNPATIARLGRFHQLADRDRGLAGHALLRRLLSAVTGQAAAEVELRTRCVGCGQTDHGKPYLEVGGEGPQVELNLSHSGAVVCVALAAPGVRIGVDVERRRQVDWSAMRRSVFSDPEWAVTETAADPAIRRMDVWSRKEAAVKASGHGLTLPLRQVLIEDTAAGWTAVLPGDAGRAAGWDLNLHPDFASAIARHEGGPATPVSQLAVRRVRLNA